MRYKKEIIFEDQDMWDTGESMYRIAKRIGANQSLLHNMRYNRVSSYENYKKYRDLVQGINKKG